MADSILDVENIYMLVMCPVSLTASVMSIYFLLAVSTGIIYVLSRPLYIFFQDVYTDFKYLLIYAIVWMAVYLISECVVGQTAPDQVWKFCTF